VETAVEAMKMGAVDYMVKPFGPDALEKTIQEALGPVQMEIKPMAVTEVAIAEPAVVENLAVTRFHPLCRVCSYSGFSDFCDFFQTGKCAYHEALEESKRLQKQWVATGEAKDRGTRSWGWH